MTATPNIIVFLSDDHGQWALPCYGNSELSTPNIDRLAACGTVFENAFTPIPVCSPARASFFTGLMPSQHGVHDFIGAAPQFHRRDWLGGLDTLPRQLQRAGYHCGFVGKWHLGDDETPQPGFDFWYAMSGEYPVAHGGSHEISDQGRVMRKSGYLTETTTQAAQRFLATRDRARPFFLFVGYYATHSPWEGHPEELVSRYRHCQFRDIPPTDKSFDSYQLVNVEAPQLTDQQIRESRAQYYGAVSHIDWGVGRILDTVAAGAEDTVFVYTSDHGLCLGHHAIWGKANATRPANMIEESIRIPMIVARAGVSGGQRRSESVDHPDLYKTLQAMAGLSPDELDGLHRPGADFGPLLSDGAQDWAKKVQFGEYGPLRMARSDRYKLIRRQDGLTELYDLAADPHETAPIVDSAAGSRPARELSALLDAYFDALDRPANGAWVNRRGPHFNVNEAWR